MSNGTDTYFNKVLEIANRIRETKKTRKRRLSSESDSNSDSLQRKQKKKKKRRKSFFQSTQYIFCHNNYRMYKLSMVRTRFTKPSIFKKCVTKDMRRLFSLFLRQAF